MTVQDVIDRALSRSRRFVPPGERGETATATELVPMVQASLDALFAIGARVNPTFYGASEVVAYSAGEGGWPRPDGAESVEWIERADGEEVFVVPSAKDQRKGEPGKPCVYRWGQVYRPAGVTPGPNAGEALEFFYSRVAATLTDENSPIDPAFPVRHAPLLELDVAARLALKDGGPTAEILPPLRDERRTALARYVAFLEHETAEVRRLYGPGTRTYSLVSLEAMLAGGGA